MDVNLPTGLKGDQSRLRQVLNNLVANAIKFTEHGDVIVRATRVADTADDVIVRFEVVDTGIGGSIRDAGTTVPAVCPGRGLD